MIKQRESLLGIKVPTKLKESVSVYCDRNGIKIKYFVAEAIMEKLSDILEDEFDNAVVDERLEKPSFSNMDELGQYLKKRKNS